MRSLVPPLWIQVHLVCPRALVNNFRGALARSLLGNVVPRLASRAAARHSWRRGDSISQGASDAGGGGSPWRRARGRAGGGGSEA